MKIAAEYGFEALVPVYQTAWSQSCKAVMSVLTWVPVSVPIHNHIDQWNSTLPQIREHCNFTFGRFLVCISPLRCFVRRFVVAFLRLSRQNYIYDTFASPHIVSFHHTLPSYSLCRACSGSCWLADWLTDWLADWMTGWLADWLTDWLAGWLTN